MFVKKVFFLTLVFILLSVSIASIMGSGWNFLLTGYDVADETSSQGDSNTEESSSSGDSQPGSEDGGSVSQEQTQQSNQTEENQGEDQTLNSEQETVQEQTGQNTSQEEELSQTPSSSSPPCPPPDSLSEISNGCQEHGGTATQRIDPSGCIFIDCSFGNQKPSQQTQVDPFSGQVCQSQEEAQQQADICAQIGTQPVALPPQGNCAPRIICSQNGQGGLSYKQYQDGQQKFANGEISSTQVLQAILKMDSIKIQIASVQKNMEDIATYYDSQGDTTDAQNYRKAIDILAQVSSKIDEEKQTLKDAIEAGTLDYNTIYQIKSDLQYSVDDLMNQVISALLGVQYTGSTAETGQQVQSNAEQMTTQLDCGTNGFCFQNDFQSCIAGASFTPESGTTITITGVTNDDRCTIQISGSFGEGTCTVPNYRFAQLSKEAIAPYCQGLPFESDQQNFEQQKQEVQDQVQQQDQTEVGINETNSVNSTLEQNTNETTQGGA